MRFRINRLELLNSLNKVSKAVDPRTPLQALTGIKVTLNEEGLELIGSDSDLSIKCFIPVVKNEKKIIEAEEYGSIVFNAKKICDSIRVISSDIVEITVIDNSAKIKSDKSVFSLDCIPSIDYPSILFEEVNPNNSFEIDAIELKTLLEQTLFATSDKESRPVLTGLNFNCVGNTLKVNATDSYRLSKKVLKIEGDLNFNVTIPAKSLDDISKIIEIGQKVKISISDKKVSFDVGNCIIHSRVISGAFPDTERLLPDTFAQVLNISTKEFIGAINSASVVLTEKNNVIKLNMTKDEVYVSSKSIEGEYVVEKIDEYSYEGENLILSFSAKYVLDAIRALGSEEITLNFSGDMKPIIIKSQTNPDLTELILPVRTYN